MLSRTGEVSNEMPCLRFEHWGRICGRLRYCRMVFPTRHRSGLKTRLFVVIRLCHQAEEAGSLPERC